jgi:hypothetical protein
MGPLKRGSDRVEFASRLVAALVVVLAVPVALTVATVAGADAAQRAAEQSVSRSQVAAVLLTDAAGTAQSAAESLPVSTPALWRAPDGSARVGEAPAPWHARAGDKVTIWVDQDGDRTAPPMERTGVICAAILGGVLTILTAGLLAWAGHLTVCRALWRYRARQWELGWNTVEPQWAGRR